MSDSDNFNPENKIKLFSCPEMSKNGREKRTAKHFGLSKLSPFLRQNLSFDNGVIVK